MIPRHHPSCGAEARGCQTLPRTRARKLQNHLSRRPINRLHRGQSVTSGHEVPIPLRPISERLVLEHHPKRLGRLHNSTWTTVLRVGLRNAPGSHRVEEDRASARGGTLQKPEPAVCRIEIGIVDSSNRVHTTWNTRSKSVVGYDT